LAHNFAATLMLIFGAISVYGMLEDIPKACEAHGRDYVVLVIIKYGHTNLVRTVVFII
jgi:hypothetical protein